MAWTWTKWQVFYGGGGGRRLYFATLWVFFLFRFLMYIVSAMFSLSWPREPRVRFFSPCFSRQGSHGSFSFGGLAAGLLFGIRDRAVSGGERRPATLAWHCEEGRRGQEAGIARPGRVRWSAESEEHWRHPRCWIWAPGSGGRHDECLVPVRKHYVWGQESKRMMMTTYRV